MTCFQANRIEILLKNSFSWVVSSLCTRVKCSQPVAISDKLFDIFVLHHTMTAKHFACHDVYMYEGMLACNLHSISIQSHHI